MLAIFERLYFAVKHRFEKDDGLVFKTVSLNDISGCKIEYRINCVCVNGYESYLLSYSSNFHVVFENKKMVDVSVYKAFVKELRVIVRDWRHNYSGSMLEGVMVSVFSSKPYCCVTCDNAFPDNIDAFYKLLDAYFGDLRKRSDVL